MADATPEQITAVIERWEHSGAATFNRRVLEPFVAAVSNRQAPLQLADAIPDHPWIDSADGAAVRIAMTVTAPGHSEGILEKVIAEQAREDGENKVTLYR